MSVELENELEVDQQVVAPEEEEEAPNDEKDQENDEDGSEPSDEETEGEEPKTAEDQRKEIQERLLEQDKALEDTRANIKQDWQDIEESHKAVERSFSNPVPLNGKPAFLATDEEFEAAEDAILDSGNADMIALLRQARKERREYQKKVQALAPRFNKVSEQRIKQTLADIEQVKSALADISPEYKQHFKELETLMEEEFKANPAKMERFVWSGVRDKFRFIDRLLDDSGIKQRVESEINAKTRPNLAMPGGAGKGKKSTPAGSSSKKIYTRAEVKQLTKSGLTDEMEKELDRALAEGRIK